MVSKRSVFKVIAAAAVGAVLSIAASQDLFTSEQAEAGRVVYKDHCQVCHGDRLLSGEMGGPPLSGSFFFNRWEGKTIGELYSYTQEFMPFGRGGTLSKSEYSDVIAFVLEYNGFGAGETELAPDSETMDFKISKPGSE
jgi:mono/diheme cytochrome c family protein